MDIQIFIQNRNNLTTRRSFERSAIAIVGSGVTILAIASINPGFAQERLLPTEIPTGDCVAPNILLGC